jgi:hypothetical protein
MGNADVVKGFHWSGGQGGLVTPPSPRNLSTDSNRPRRRKRSSSSWGRGRSTSRGAVDVDHFDRGAESESCTTSTHPSSLGECPYTPSLSDDSSTSDPNPDIDLDSLRKGSCLLCLSDASGSGGGCVHQLES